jgi:WD40 repeat protein
MDARGPFPYGETVKWSPDASTLAFDSDDAFTLLDERTLDVRTLPLHALHAIASFAWSPNSDAIAFTQGDDGASVIHLVDTSSGGLTRLPGFTGSDVHILAWIRVRAQ